MTDTGVSDIISYSNEVSGLGEGSPGDMEPTGASQQLVGIGTGLQELYQSMELLGRFRPDVGSLAQEVLGVLDTTYLAIDSVVAEAGIDDDRANLATGGFQQQLTAIGQVY